MTAWLAAASFSGDFFFRSDSRRPALRHDRRRWLCRAAAAATTLFLPGASESTAGNVPEGPHIHLLDGSREPALNLQLDSRGTLSWKSGRRSREGSWHDLWHWGAPLDPLLSLAAMAAAHAFALRQRRGAGRYTVFQGFAPEPSSPRSPHFAAGPDAPPGSAVSGKPLPLRLVGNTLTAFQSDGKPEQPAAPLRLHPGDSAYVLLPEGGLIVADLRAAARGHLGLVSLLGRKLELPWSQVAGVLIAPPADPLRAAAWEVQVRDHRGPGDLCLLANGDRLRGTVVALDRQRLQIRLASGEVSVPLPRIKLVALDPKLFPPPPPPGSRAAWLGLFDGSILPVSNLLLGGEEVRCRLLGIQPLRFRQRELVWIQPRHEHAPFLSDRKPDQFRHVPLLRSRWPLQRDRNVGGGLLRAGGRRWLKGLGMHSLSQATYLLKRPAQRLLAYAAVDDQAGPRGAVVFRVITFHRTSSGVEKRIAFTTPVIRRGDPPRLVNVPLKDAAAVSLVVQYGPGGDQHDWADWLAPVLVSASG